MTHSRRQVVILAGGRATRMQPRPFTVPKAMLDVAVLEQCVENYRASGTVQIALHPEN